MQLLVLMQEYLTEHFDFDATPILDRYNRRMGRMYDDFRDFLVMHYQGGRDDTDFWRSISMNDSARERLDLWRHKTPITTDLDPYFGAIDMKLWFFTLDGLGLLDSGVARREMDYYGPLGRGEPRPPRAAREVRPLRASRGPARPLPGAGPRQPPRSPRSPRRRHARAARTSAAPNAAAAHAAASLACFSPHTVRSRPTTHKLEGAPS